MVLVCRVQVQAAAAEAMLQGLEPLLQGLSPHGPPWLSFSAMYAAHRGQTDMLCGISGGCIQRCKLIKVLFIMFYYYLVCSRRRYRGVALLVNKWILNLVHRV